MRPLSYEPLPTGARIAAYEIVRVMGSGGMGTVYEAMHQGLEKRVAIKTLHPSLAMDAECVARFVREGKLAARLRHPNVVDVTDVGVHEGSPYLVMEYLDGETLAELLARTPVLAVPDALRLLLPVAAALVFAHSEKVVHRDLKPENVFLARSRVGPSVSKLLDFGISKIAMDGETLTATQAVIGTPYYMSPEQARSAKRADARSDQWSLGVMLYECVTGRLPYDGRTALEILARLTMMDPDPPSSHLPDLPAGLDAIILRSLSRDPAARFPSIAAFALALMPFADRTTRATWKGTFETSAGLTNADEIGGTESTVTSSLADESTTGIDPPTFSRGGTPALAPGAILVPSGAWPPSGALHAPASGAPQSPPAPTPLPPSGVTPRSTEGWPIPQLPRSTAPGAGLRIGLTAAGLTALLTLGGFVAFGLVSSRTPTAPVEAPPRVPPAMPDERLTDPVAPPTISIAVPGASHAADPSLPTDPVTSVDSGAIAASPLTPEPASEHASRRPNRIRPSGTRPTTPVVGHNDSPIIR